MEKWEAQRRRSRLIQASLSVRNRQLGGDCEEEA
jgi:hypothetical protein